MNGTVTANGKIVGVVSNKGSLSGNVTGRARAVGKLVGSIIRIDYEPYTGDYEVASLPWQDRTLETYNKRMTENMTVKKIPYAETPNPYGTTISISS